jgi:competence protein ComEA
MKFRPIGWLKQYIRNTFGFSETETNGTIFLWLLMLVCWGLPSIYGKISSQKLLSDSTDTQKLNEILVKLQEVNTGDSPEFDELLADNSADSLFYFNPNEVSVTEWQKLGADQKLAKRILNYTTKGGKFRKKEDVQKIYGFPSDLYKRIEDYMQFPQSQGYAKKYYNKKPFDTTNKKRKYEKKEYAKKEYERKEIQPFDLNTADTTQLKQIKGIGTKISQRIIAYRDRIGGFHNIKQVREVYGLDTLRAIDELEKYALLQTPVKKIYINQILLEDLQKNIYVGKGLAKVIINYRTQNGKFSSPQDLAKIKILKPEILEKLIPYLSFE